MERIYVSLSSSQQHFVGMVGGAGKPVCQLNRKLQT